MVLKVDWIKGVGFSSCSSFSMIVFRNFSVSARHPSPVAVMIACTFSEGRVLIHSSPQATPILTIRLIRLRSAAFVIILL